MDIQIFVLFLLAGLASLIAFCIINMMKAMAGSQTESLDLLFLNAVLHAIISGLIMVLFVLMSRV